MPLGESEACGSGPSLSCELEIQLSSKYPDGLTMTVAAVQYKSSKSRLRSCEHGDIGDVPGLDPADEGR